MILVEKTPKANGGYGNMEASTFREGYYILPDELKPEHFPFFTINAVESDVITSVTDGEYPAVSAEITRRKAYESEPIVEYGGNLITVDEARNICMEYEFETTDRAIGIVSELMAKITAAKEAIRARYTE